MVRVLKNIEQGVPECYSQDVKRIQKVMHDAGFPMTRQEAYSRWNEHSSSWCAGWLILPDDDEDIVWDLTEEEDD